MTDSSTPSDTSTITEIKVAQLRIGTKFYVEPADAEPIPVEMIGLATWGLVHGCFDVPCHRLDSGESVMVSLHRDDTLRLVTA